MRELLLQKFQESRVGFRRFLLRLDLRLQDFIQGKSRIGVGFNDGSVKCLESEVVGGGSPLDSSELDELREGVSILGLSLVPLELNSNLCYFY